MKSIINVCMLLWCLCGFANPPGVDPNDVVEELICEITTVNNFYNARLTVKQDELSKINGQLATASGIEEKVNLLMVKDRIKDEMELLKRANTGDITRLRYIKGLQVIKLLYEKVLSLDHHFSSVRTFSEISKMSNPNQYPEFSKMKDIVASKKDKKASVDLTSILGTNPLVSVVQTFTNMIGSSLTKEEKDTELASVECILDFTLRMHNDLNTIYYETSFLTASNAKVKEDIEVLFRDYTKPIDYNETLEKCRANDDWEAIITKLDAYAAKTQVAQGAAQDKMQINMAFPVDRLMQFITEYNAFIDQGGKFYEKFKIILNSYENEKQCETKLPIEYKKLKEDMDVAINKFNVAYRPVEINGSKMKEIIYGLNEFE